ncbi:MAG TPA: hypothetical protein VEX70_10975 [Pyrinomonadaceae bacterium]|jgi:hypothetical protein|nr:hypothetical protein [Pyrinomonadaceae bacterium]
MRKKIMCPLLCLILLQACGLFHTQTYLIPANMKPRWITIEYKNPKCAPLKDVALGEEIMIPESGFLCTSSSQYSGWHKREYFLLNEKGERTPLKVSEHIWGESSFRKAEGALPDGKFRCNLEGGEFFYGSEGGVSEENPIIKDEAFLKYHPECREAGVGSIPSP